MAVVIRRVLTKISEVEIAEHHEYRRFRKNKKWYEVTVLVPGPPTPTVFRCETDEMKVER